MKRIDAEKLRRLTGSAKKSLGTAAAIAEAGLSAAGERAGAAVADARLQLEHRALEREAAQLLQKLGALVYATHRGSPCDSDALQAVLKQVDRVYGQMAANESRQKNNTQTSPSPNGGRNME